MKANKVALLDVNLLVALAWPNHIHHREAHRWFEQQQSRGWATCPTTQSGFVRVSSNRKVIPGARTVEEVLRLLQRITDLPHHVFWHDDIELARSEYVSSGRLLGYRQVSDAHLLALALSRGGRLATLDRGLSSILPGGFSADEALDQVLLAT